MDDHHFNYITKLEKKRGINENSITWANHYAVIFLFIGSFAYLQVQTQFHLVKMLYFIQSIKYKLT
jgi:hypothetical protein